MNIKYHSLYEFRIYFSLASHYHLDEFKVQTDQDGVEWTLASLVNNFMQSFYETDLADKNYSTHVEECRKNGAEIGLTNDMDIIKQGDMQTVKAYLTMCIRMDRFCEGSLIEAARNGTLYELLARLHELELEAAGDTGADLTEEDEEILDRVWDYVGKKFALKDQE